MSVRDTTGRDRARLLRAGGLLAAVLAAVGLVVLPVPAGDRARADAGPGSSDSSVTESGTKGAYDDFSKLRVTVEQTKNLRGQGVKVTWSGGTPTRPGEAGIYGSDFLQIMQCWGNSPDGPDRDQCVFGEPPASIGSEAVRRSVAYADGSGLEDPRETLPASPNGQVLPFRAVTGQSTTDVQTYFTPLTSNEQPVTATGADGTGETVFQLESAVEADFMGCGDVARAGGTPEPCWLVVVPRGEHEPNGSAPDGGLRTSPLSASNWAQRIVFRLNFEPIGVYCPIGQKEQATIGSEMANEAMSSWQPTLCTEDKITFGYVLQNEDYARDQVLTGGQNSPLGFVEDPIVPPDGSPPVVHAPVAVSGLVIGYNIQQAGSSRQVPRVRLDARLVAKMLTESYQCDLPGPNTQVVRGRLPKENAQDVPRDPEFIKLNPDLGYFENNTCRYDLQVPQGQSDYAAQLWRWLRSDPKAEAFLKGEPDEWGMRINPNFLALHPATDALNEFPKPDPTSWTPAEQAQDLTITPVTINPYGQDLHDDATRVRKANNTGATTVDTNVLPPKLAQSPQLPGQYFNFGLTDAATAARYRLGTAELLNADGQYVAPTAASLSKAVGAMKDGSVPGVLDQDPGRKVADAYPLTTVTYAAASTALPSTTRTDFATMIRYAAGVGQQSGIGNGLLPPGYAPLPKTLRDQALAAATQLVTGVPPTAAGATAGSDGGTDGAGGALTAGGSGGSGSLAGATGGGASGTSGGTAGGGSGAAAGGATPSSSATAVAAGRTGGPGASPPAHNVAATGGATPRRVLGAVRWVLLAVLVAGVAGGLAGPLLVRAGTAGPGGGVPSPLRRLRRLHRPRRRPR